MLATKFYRSVTHAGRYLNFKLNHPSRVKIFIQRLHNRASTICQELQDLFNENSKLRRDFQLSVYPQVFVDSVINSRITGRPNIEENLSALCRSHISSIVEVWLRERSMLGNGSINTFL
jgi:hypothetical protein